MKSRNNVFLASIASIAAIAVFGDNLSQIWANKFWMGFYVFFDFFLIELIVAVLLFRFWREIWSFLKKGLFDLVSMWRKDYRFAAVFTILLTGFTALAIYQAAWYGKGKTVKWRMYSNKLIERASGAFSSGKPSVAMLHLEVGRTLLESRRCIAASERLMDRMELMDEGRAALGLAGKSPWIRFQLIRDLRIVSNGQPEFENLAEAEMKDLDYARRTFSESARALSEGEIDEARSGLEEIHGRFGDIWHCITLIDSIRGRDVPDYTESLKAIGPDHFTRDTLEFQSVEKPLMKPRW